MARYALVSGSNMTPPFIRIAALRLAEGDIRKLRSAVATARQDYRDVLAYAEYPGYFDSVPAAGALSPEERKRIIDADWNQYREWLSR